MWVGQSNLKLLYFIFELKIKISNKHRRYAWSTRHQRLAHRKSTYSKCKHLNGIFWPKPFPSTSECRSPTWDCRIGSFAFPAVVCPLGPSSCFCCSHHICSRKTSPGEIVVCPIIFRRHHTMHWMPMCFGRSRSAQLEAEEVPEVVVVVEQSDRCVLNWERINIIFRIDDFLVDIRHLKIFG